MAAPEPLVSVVVPSYNYGAYVGETVRSAILRAGGVAPWADLSGAWIERSDVVVARLRAEGSYPVATPSPRVRSDPTSTP